MTYTFALVPGFALPLTSTLAWFVADPPTGAVITGAAGGATTIPNGQSSVATLSSASKASTVSVCGPSGTLSTTKGASNTSATAAWSSPMRVPSTRNRTYLTPSGSVAVTPKAASTITVPPLSSATPP